MRATVLLMTLLVAVSGGRLVNAAPSVLAPDVLATPTPTPTPIVKSQPNMKAATRVEVQAFRKLYAAGDVATARRDIAYLNDISTNDYALRFRTGAALNKAQWLNLTAQVLRRALKFNAVRTRVERIGTQKNIAVVVATSTIDMLYRGLDEKTHRSVSTSQVMDTWILLKQGWRMMRSQEIVTRSTVDGRARAEATSSTR